MISCELHSYVEIACMYHFPIKLTLKTGETIEGISQDIGKNDQDEECIEIAVNKKRKLIELMSLSMLEVLVENPHFKRIQFD